MSSDRFSMDDGEKFVKSVALSAAKNVVSGLGGLIMDEMLDAIFGSGPSTEQIIARLLDEAVVRFGEKVKQEFEQDDLEDAQAALVAVMRGMRVVNRSIRHLGPDWWQDTVTLHRLLEIEGASTTLVAKLEGLQLPGWPSYMMAVTFRLRILATLMQHPDHKKIEMETMVSEVGDYYAPHHWQMCRELDRKILSCFQPIVRQSSYKPSSFAVRFTDAGCFLEIATMDAWELLHSLGLTEQEWLAVMTPVRESMGDPFGRREIGPDELLWHWKTGAVHILKESGQFGERIRAEMITRRDSYQFWMWSHFMEAVTSSLQDMVLEWWLSADMARIRKVALRTYDGKYVATELGDRGQLVANRDRIREWETYELIDFKNGRVALRAWNKQYVAPVIYRAFEGYPEYAQLVATRPWLDSWETFRLVDAGEGKVAFRAANGKYVTRSYRGGNGRPRVVARELVATGAQVGEQGKFKLIDLG